MSKYIKISISYGYDIHSLILDENEHTLILQGAYLELDGQGFVHEEEGLITDHWVFNRNPGEIMFWLDNGANFYAQTSWIEDN